MSKRLDQIEAREKTSSDIAWLLDQLRKAEGEIEQACADKCLRCGQTVDGVFRTADGDWWHDPEYLCDAAPIRDRRFQRQQESK